MGAPSAVWGSPFAPWKETMSPGYITIKEAMEKTGWSASWLKQLCKGGRLRARKVGPVWTISEASLDGFMKLDRPAHRPPKRRRAKG